MALHPSLSASIPSLDLANISAGVGVAQRSSAGSDQLAMMLTQITSSIKDLATNKNQSDPTQLLMMMMLMGGGGIGGGGGGGPAPMPAPPPPAPGPVVHISTRIRH